MTNPSTIKNSHMQKIWKNHDKKLEIKRINPQKIPPKLDKKWSTYEFLKIGHANEIKIEN